MGLDGLVRRGGKPTDTAEPGDRKVDPDTLTRRRPDLPCESLVGALIIRNLEPDATALPSLLTLARAEEAVTDRRPVDLAQLAGYALDVTAKAAAEQQVQVQAQLAAAPVLGDPILLEQLIRNLVDNAVRYNYQHGFVCVQTLAEVRQAEIIVTNTGAPISPHEVPALFEPFRRLTDRVGSARGSGLGLSIVRAVAQAHGGDALAIPRPDGGLSVRVILPRSDAPRA